MQEEDFKTKLPLKLRQKVALTFFKINFLKPTKNLPASKNRTSDDGVGGGGYDDDDDNDRCVYAELTEL